MSTVEIFWLMFGLTISLGRLSPKLSAEYDTEAETTI